MYRRHSIDDLTLVLVPGPQSEFLEVRLPRCGIYRTSGSLDKTWLALAHQQGVETSHECPPAATINARTLLQQAYR